jgi:hypothetical protein
VIENLKNVFMTATSFLQNGVAPPNTPIAQKIELEKQNHLSSKKFFIVFTSFLVLFVFYFVSVCVLFFLPNLPEYITGFVAIFSKTIEVLSIIIASYLGTQAIVDLRYGSNSNVSLQSSSQHNINQNTQTIHIIEEGDLNAPKVKPFSSLAYKDGDI